MALIIGNSMVSTVRVKTLSRLQSTLSRPRDLIQKGTFTQDQAYLFDEEIRKLHPANRGLDTGFYDYEPDRVK